jgi:branched-chain amino acid transport system substrate-binding protein
LVAIFVASNLGGEGGVEKTPTAAETATVRAALVTKAVPTATPKREPTPTQKPSRPGEELRAVHFENMYLESDFEAPSELRDLPDGWAVGDDGSANHVLIGKEPHTLAFPDSMEWPVYTLDMRVMLVEGQEGHLLVREAEEKGISLVFAEDRWELVQQPDDRIVDRYEANNKGVWHHLRVVAVEDRLAAFLDGDLMFDTEVGPLPGIVGLRVYKGSKIFVDDLHIAGPPLPRHAEVVPYDDFDQGVLDPERWEWLPAVESDIARVDEGGGLVIEAENPEPEERYGRLVARTDRPLVEVQADLAIITLQGEHTGLRLYLSAEGDRMAGIMGEAGSVMAFEEEGGLRVLLEGRGLPAEYHLRLTLKPDGLMHVFVNGREVGDIPAPPVAGGFAITYRLDPGGSLMGHVDNVEVRYFDEDAMPSQPPPEGSLPCEDELGCVQVPPDAPIHIAYLLDLSGVTGATGEDSLRSAKLAVERKREILGHPIELTGEDAGCNPEAGETAALAIVADPSVVAVIGTSCSNSAQVVAPIISQAGLVMVSPSNTRVMLTDPKVHEPGYLRVAPNDRAQGEAIAHFVREVLGVERVATLYEEDPYTEALQRVFAEVFKDLGGEVTVQMPIQPDEAQIHSTLSSVAQTKPELIFYPLFVEMGGNVTRLARETPGLEGTLLMGADGMLVPELLEVAGPAAEGVYLSSPDFSAAGDEYQAFLEAYQRTYGEAPRSPFHAYAYDATMMVLAAIEQVAEPTDDGALSIGRQALRDALYATRDFAGLTGNLTCTPHGDCADVRIAVYRVVDAAPETWEPGRNPERVWP